MSVIYSQAVRSARLNAVGTALGPDSKLLIKNSTGETLVTIPLLATAPTTSNDDLVLIAAQVSASVSVSGTASQAVITMADGTTQIVTGLTVGQSATDIIFDSVTLASDQTVLLNSAKITHPTA